jgi:3-hydroxybutyryl-CoA dehydrogenase
MKTSLLKRKHQNRTAVFYFCTMIEKICVAGAGTMGSGIALAASQAGFPVVLFDTNTAVLEKAGESINKNLQFLADKHKITPAQRTGIFGRIHFTAEISDCKANLVIEAIVEKMAAKADLFHRLAAINTADCIFASNTSSLSVSALQNEVLHPERVAGMHFFNPAQVMKLVEIIQGHKTAEEVIRVLMAFSVQLGKTPVLCKDAPGFIVNRVARPYYLEAMKLVESGIATLEDVDDVMEASGFKMGPFRLMDLIGMDINLAVSQSLYHALGEVPRLRPSPLQVEKVNKGELGRKSGKGFYNYQP